MRTQQRQRVTRTLLIIFLILLVFSNLGIYHKYRTPQYEHVPEDKIKEELYKATTELFNRTKKYCKYDEILNRTISLSVWEAKNISNFSSTDIVKGAFIPSHCDPVFSVAILVTYRKRIKQLSTFLPYIHNFLRKQNIHYRIYVIEQQDSKPWNKGLLYNIGAKIAIADKFPCLILHDVDLLPLDERNLYVCSDQPRHMSACIDKFRYILPYNHLVGGVLAIRSDQYLALNGFSNRFHGWGGEDDDFAARMRTYGLSLTRFPSSMSRYTMLRHPPEQRNPERFLILEENRRISGDGITAVRFTNVKVKQLHLFTLIRVVS